VKPGEYTLGDAIGSAQDNMPDGYELSIAFLDGQWRVHVLRPDRIEIWGYGACGAKGLGMTEAIVHAIEFARDHAVESECPSETWRPL
jgi:hypothetical protein